MTTKALQQPQATALPPAALDRLAELDHECEADARLNELPPLKLHRRLMPMVKATLAPADADLLGDHLQQVDLCTSRWLRCTLASAWADFQTERGKR
jgi:hypothetical protein